ncbi:LysM peptidoglycan-binding domain-containing protein [Psychroserpens sp. NJDZ02]|uniref:PBP1 and LysM peptidoglycan-binding domain-containing protein n=1 Tax=Psychroserpens sp. NJDZ02 TaxID=2570561 RepID=UPI0010A86BAF|nr:LysM peptidoglycan-binding domain-containing protein [Psychroserpens sp. NJDZ02]QCE40183.1 LysM peptidoglycan-binding domain-containing protein [Psychroserpens sp. NJDZ02]
MRKLIYILSLVALFGCVSAKAQNYKTHKVQVGETIEQIATKYSVTKSQIYALNPDARKDIKPDSVLIIPNDSVVPNRPSVSEVKALEGFKKHKVKRKETLYSLAKKYNVDQEDIKKHNPDLYANNLRKGDKIKIPIYKVTKEVVEAEGVTTSYTVKPKEGKWRIAYQYGITVQELESLNPDMEDVLQPGSVITVPNLKVEEVKDFDEKYSYHTVLKSEGFYRLKVKTGLTQEELEKLNPDLLTTGLKEGMVLKIPYDANIRSINEGSGPLTIGEDLPSSDLTSRDLDSETKHIAIMLPFKLNEINSESAYDTKKFITDDPYSSISLDFYSGVKIALDSLSTLGVNLKVDVYDTENRESQVTSLLQSNAFDDVHAVIGPIMPKLFNIASASLKSKNIPLISPITKTINLSDNVFQSIPSEDLIEQALLNYFKADSTANFIIISDMKNKERATELKKTFPKAALVMSRKVKKTGADSYYILDGDMVRVLKSGKNVVFLETANPGFISNVSSILNSKIKPNIEIVLTTSDKNKAFEDDEVRNTHLSNLSFTYGSINKSFSEDDNNSFGKRYKALYSETPNKYAVRGFDLTMDVVLRLVTSEDLYLSAIESPLTTYVENKFAYKKKLFGGYFNNTVYLVKYQDLKVVEVEK